MGLPRRPDRERVVALTFPPAPTACVEECWRTAQPPARGQCPESDGLRQAGLWRAVSAGRRQAPPLPFHDIRAEGGQALPLDENAPAAMVGFYLHQNVIQKADRNARYGR